MFQPKSLPKISFFSLVCLQRRETKIFLCTMTQYCKMTESSATSNAATFSDHSEGTNSGYNTYDD